jgi:hypothetical protein
MAEKTIPKLIFVLLVLCVFMAAPMAYLSHDPPTIMQTRFMDSQNVAIDPTRTSGDVRFIGISLPLSLQTPPIIPIRNRPLVVHLKLPQGIRVFSDWRFQ